MYTRDTDILNSNIEGCEEVRGFVDNVGELVLTQLFVVVEV